MVGKKDSLTVGLMVTLRVGSMAERREFQTAENWVGWTADCLAFPKACYWVEMMADCWAFRKACY
jgi:hypothetical protein